MIKENVCLHSLTKLSEKQMYPVNVVSMLSKIHLAKGWSSHNHKTKENQNMWILIPTLQAVWTWIKSDNISRSNLNGVKKYATGM